jgi:hypothetical protein
LPVEDIVAKGMNTDVHDIQDEFPAKAGGRNFC